MPCRTQQRSTTTIGIGERRRALAELRDPAVAEKSMSTAVHAGARIEITRHGAGVP
jgi:hypothetical protein